MSNTFTITEKNMSKLKELIASAIEAEEDIDEAVDAWKATLKAAPKGGKKAKKPVDKEMIEAIGEKPKKAPSAYMCYGTEVRAATKAKNPDATFGEMTKLIATAWNKIKDDKKKSAKYHDMAAKAKASVAKELASYEKKLKAYKAKNGESEGEDASEEKPAKKGKAPARKAPAKPTKGKAKDVSEDEELEGEEKYAKMKIADLKTLCKEREVDIKGKTKKEDIVAALVEADGEGQEKEDEATAEEVEEEEVEDDEE